MHIYTYHYNPQETNREHKNKNTSSKIIQNYQNGYPKFDDYGFEPESAFPAKEVYMNDVNNYNNDNHNNNNNDNDNTYNNDNFYNDNNNGNNSNDSNHNNYNNDNDDNNNKNNIMYFDENIKKSDNQENEGTGNMHENNNHNPNTQHNNYDDNKHIIQTYPSIENGQKTEKPKNRKNVFGSKNDFIRSQMKKSKIEQFTRKGPGTLPAHYPPYLPPHMADGQFRRGIHSLQMRIYTYV
jgi:hypothetical protein